jgi:ribosomal protein L12E/L44/L45/RPP1/RPP2
VAQAQSEDDNSWPGYVDALTTMTMMLVFIMVLLAAAIFGLSQQASREMIQKVADAANIKVDLETESVQVLMAKVTEKVHHDRLMAAQTAIAKAASGSAETVSKVVTMVSKAVPGGVLDAFSRLETPAPPQPSAVQVTRDDAMLRIKFNPRATGLDPATESQIEAFLRTDPRLASELVIEIKAYAVAEDGISDSRRIAFHRMMNVRSRLLQIGIKPSRIEARLHDVAPDGLKDDVQVFVREPA